MNDWRTRLKAVIAERDISLPDLANRASYDYVTLWKALIKEKHVIKRTTMNRICQVLKVDPDYIWYGNEGPPVRKGVPMLSDAQVLPWVEDQAQGADYEYIGTPYRIMSERAFAWRNTAVDMQGLVALGDIAYFNPDLVPDSLEYVLALYRGSILFRRYAEIVDQKYLMPYDPAFHPLTMGIGDRIIAVAVGVYSKLVKDNRPENIEKRMKYDDGQAGELIKEP